MDQKLKQARITAGLITLLFHVVLIVGSIYIVVWSAPEELFYGIEINFGLEEAGRGKVQPPVRPTKTKVSTPKPVVQNTTPAAEKVAVETASEVSEGNPPTEKTAIPPQTEAEQKQQPAAKVTLPTPPDLESVSSQGNTEAETGDQGSQQGTLNADALLTDPQNIPAGAQLDMPGWGWQEPPEKADQSQEQGKIIFEITIDENGEIIAIKTKFRSVSKVVANFYQAEVDKLIFVPNNPDANHEGITKGYITFIIKAK